VNEEFQTARSYRTGIIDDNAYITINWKLLVQFAVCVFGLGYTYMDLQNRIEGIEEELVQANLEIRRLISKHQLEESAQLEALEDKLKFYEKELNINPLSWRKRKKK
tara:strand:+ start:142 stop:462 length:321 start_codon:yes stop_codon:yes gene_type:complete